MSYFGKNIKKLRKIKNLSQSAFADIFSLTRASIGAYEEGRAEAKIDTIIEIARYFNLTVDQLLGSELTTNELLHFKNLKEKINKSLFSETTQVTQKSKDGMLLVGKSMLADYPDWCQNPDFIDRLPLLKLLSGDASQIRAFEKSGDDMRIGNSGIFEGDILLTKSIPNDDFEKISDGLVYSIVTGNIIYIRRVFKEKGQLVLKADNPSFQPVILGIDNILEIWEVTGFYSTRLYPVNDMEIRMANLEKMVEQLLGNSKSKLTNESS